jgi:hypothetical protein
MYANNTMTPSARAAKQLSRAAYESGATKVFDEEGFTGLMAQFEAAGCIGADDPLACTREAIEEGRIADPASVGNQIANMKRACERGGVASCTDLLKRNSDLDLGCTADVIHSWTDKVRCDCDTMKCAEVTPLTNKQRDAQQRGGFAGSIPVVPIAIAGAVAFLGWRWWSRR